MSSRIVALSLTDGRPARRAPGAATRIGDVSCHLWFAGTRGVAGSAPVHRVFSLVKRWVMGTMQGSVSPEHVQAYFDEWVFRFNRGNSRSRGLLFYTLLEQAVAGEPVTHRSLRKAGRTRPAPSPATAVSARPPSLQLGELGLPWRRA